MEENIFKVLSEQLLRLRDERGWSQSALAERVGRNRARISELERDLAGSRWGRDRLTLFAEICDAMNVVPVMVPRSQAKAVRRQIEGAKAVAYRQPLTSQFDELFVDLGEDDEEGR
jgi:transcriptional regulator with XRE-family HTH domain